MADSTADPWSGIPDDPRKLVDNYAVADSANRGSWGGFRAELDAAEAALCAALRALVAQLKEAEAENYELRKCLKATLSCTFNIAGKWISGAPSGGME